MEGLDAARLGLSQRMAYVVELHAVLKTLEGEYTPEQRQTPPVKEHYEK